MSDVIVDETLEDIDLDDDGKISLKEYINDMYRVRILFSLFVFII